MMSAKPAFIALDWGTSSFRAYLVDVHGAVADRITSPDGILAVPNAGFAEVLRRRLTPWLTAHGRVSVLMSGMIGSRQGLVEVPYGQAPLTLEALIGGMHAMTIEGIGSVHIVPGVQCHDLAGVPDVMRGEETQIFGALATLDIAEGLFVLPGTHSKWVSVDSGAITGFETYMTGEVFAVLRQHSILGRLMPAAAAVIGPPGDGFRRGIDMIARHSGGPGGLLHRLFSVRTLGLVGNMPADQLEDYLSGLLIGAEVVEASVSDRDVFVIAGAALGECYVLAGRSFGVGCRRIPEDCVVAGLHAMASAKDLLPQSSVAEADHA